MGSKIIVATPGSTRWKGRALRLLHRARVSRWQLATVAVVAAFPIWVSFGPIGLASLAVLMLAGFALPRSLSPAAEAPAILVVGSGPIAVAMTAAFMPEGEVRYRDGRGVSRAQALATPIVHARTPAEALEMIPGMECDKVVIVDGSHQMWRPPADARGYVPRVVSGVEELEHILGRIPFAMLQHAPDRAGVTRLSRPYAFMKRCVDLAIAIPAAMLLSVFLPFIALCIVLDSRGPVFYSQTRVGLGGRHFRIYKFRSMHRDAERAGAAWAAHNDVRVTRLGKFMRSTRFDELPQLWNVIRGDMSLVGPRPERPEFTEMLEQEFPGFRLRNRVKPGLTGWSQVRIGYCRTVNESRIKLEYDFYYAAYATLLFDLSILFRTLPVVVGRKGV